MLPTLDFVTCVPDVQAQNGLAGAGYLGPG